jgi:hypothetical protein
LELTKLNLRKDCLKVGLDETGSERGFSEHDNDSSVYLKAETFVAS